MSYKAAQYIKNYLEIEFIKSQSPEELNVIFNDFNDQTKQARSIIDDLLDLCIEEVADADHISTVIHAKEFLHGKPE